MSTIPTVSTYTKSYVPGPFPSDTPLEFITLKAGDTELAKLPLKTIVRIADDLREEIERYRNDHRPDTRHTFAPNKKYPWFCKDCGYPPEHPLMHMPPAPEPAQPPTPDRPGCANCGNPASYSATHWEAGRVFVCEDCMKSHLRDHSNIRKIWPWKPKT